MISPARIMIKNHHGKSVLPQVLFPGAGLLARGTSIVDLISGVVLLSVAFSVLVLSVLVPPVVVLVVFVDVFSATVLSEGGTVTEDDGSATWVDGSAAGVDSGVETD